MTDLFSRMDVEHGLLTGGVLAERRLSDLRDAFADQQALEHALAEGNDPVIYTVSSIAHGSGQGDQHIGLGLVYPGTVGQEFYLTKGHRHLRAEASEVYVGLRGTGKMILQNASGTSVVDLLAQSVVYVPGHTDHRTVNTGKEPLVYLGIYPAWAGHDYGSLSEQNFSVVVVDDRGNPRILDRSEFVQSLSTNH